MRPAISAATLAALTFGLGAPACRRDTPAEGPAEKAGEKLDKAGRDTKDAAKDTRDDIKRNLDNK